MKIAVVWDMVPFERSALDDLGPELVSQLQQRGLEAEAVRLAFSVPADERLVEQMLAARLTHVTNADRVIALSFPSYHVPHGDKVLWLQRQLRQVYDLWGGPLQTIPATPDGRAVRAAVIAADTRMLHESGPIYACSDATRTRLRRFNGIASEVLLAPPSEQDASSSGRGRSSIVALGSIGPAGRQAMLIDAMQYVRSPAQLVIAGPPDRDDHTRQLEQRVAELGLTERVTVIARPLAAHEHAELLACATAAAVVSLDDCEAIRGALAAMGAAKPVIGGADTAAAPPVVSPGETGLVCEPAPHELAQAIDCLGTDTGLAERMGAAGEQLLAALEVSWDRVVEQLTR